MTKHKDHQQEQQAEDLDATSDTTDTQPKPFSPAFQASTAGQSAAVEKLQQQIEQLQSELAEANDKMLRSKAEADNTRRRATLDVENAHKYGIEKMAKELLNVVDGLERGLHMANDESAKLQAEHLHEGMELTYKLLVDALAKFNITVIDPAGQTFDPKQHEALTMQPSSDIEPNKVLTVVQKGFMINDRVLRPARVVVAKAPE